MKPGILCKLTHGRAIAAFKTFVETFNWLVDFCNNLRGADGVKVDRKDPDHPVIRLEGSAVAEAEDMGLWDMTLAQYLARDESDPSDPTILLKIKDGEPGEGERQKYLLYQLLIGTLKEAGGGGGLSKVKVTGTDGVTVEGSALKFAAETDSNVTVKASVDESGVITCKIGVYWSRS